MYRYFYVKFYVWKRRALNFLVGKRWARSQIASELPCLVFSHSSPIRRKLGNVDKRLQENKAQNLQLAAGKINGITLQPGEQFSFWQLVGQPTKGQGYLEGLMLSDEGMSTVLAGGLCQMTNLIHWLVLHSPMRIVEHHHHDGYDLFPDQDRKVPFGLGTSIMYNFLDYQFVNDTNNVYQLKVWVDNDELKGELRSDTKQTIKFEIQTVDENFVCAKGKYYRCNEVWRTAQDPLAEKTPERELIKKNRALVMYDLGLINDGVIIE